MVRTWPSSFSVKSRVARLDTNAPALSVTDAYSVTGGEAGVWRFAATPATSHRQSREAAGMVRSMRGTISGHRPKNKPAIFQEELRQNQCHCTLSISEAPMRYRTVLLSSLLLFLL